MPKSGNRAGSAPATARLPAAMLMVSEPIVRHACPPPATPWSAFFAWPGGASLLYLVSAACLLGGAGLVLAPAVGLEDSVNERLAMAGTVALYTGALLGVATLVCRWQRDHDDAVGLSVLLAVFLVACTAPLDVLALGRPVQVPLLAVACVVGAVGVARTWTRRVGGPLPWHVSRGAGLVLLGSAAAPALLAVAASVHGVPDPGLLLPWWQGALGIMTLGIVILARGLGRPVVASLWPRQPTILHEDLRWILGLVVAAVGTAQVWVASYSASLGLGFTDLLLPVVALLAAVDGLLAKRFSIGASDRVACWACLTALPILCVGRGALPWEAAGLTSPALASALGALRLLYLAWEARHTGLAVMGVLWAALATVGWEAAEGHQVFHPAAAGGVLVLGLMGVALALRQVTLAVLAAAIGVVGLGQHLGWSGGGVFMALGGLVLATHLVLGRRLPTPLLVAGSVALALGLLGWADAPPLTGLEASLLGMIAGVAGLVRERRRLAPLAPLLAPAAKAGVTIALHQPAWAAVGAAFLLLGVGALLSRKTAQR